MVKFEEDLYNEMIVEGTFAKIKTHLNIFTCLVRNCFSFTGKFKRTMIWLGDHLVAHCGPRGCHENPPHWNILVINLLTFSFFFLLSLAFSVFDHGLQFSLFSSRLLVGHQLSNDLQISLINSSWLCTLNKDLLEHLMSAPPIHHSHKILGFLPIINWNMPWKLS